MSVFTIFDYVLFGSFLLLSLCVGVYHAWRARRVDAEAATEDYVMGGRKLPVVPVALSLLTTFLSGIGLLGIPAEIYQNGVVFWLFYVTGFISMLISGLYFLPVFYKLHLVSIYEYFEIRFGSMALRRLVAGLFIITSTILNAIVLYAPAMALAGVTHQPLWPYILAIGLTSTLYTTIGGLKAVVWTDTLQAVFIYGGIAMLVTKGTLDAGGLSRVYQITVDSGRMASLFRFDPNPAQHTSFWICSISGVIIWLSNFGLNQLALQRYCAMPSLGHARQVMAIALPIFLLSCTCTCYIGVVMLAYFYDCDPLATKEIESKDQLVILFATKVLGSVPGMPGVFLACLFSTTLSTVSSSYNSAATVVYEDFLKQTLHGKISDRTTMLINKGLSLTFGLLSTMLAFTVKDLGGIMQVTVAALGTLGGPVVGLFLIGLLLKRASKYTAFASWIMSVTVSLVVLFGSIRYHTYFGYQLGMANTCAQLKNVTMKITPLYDPHYGNPAVPYPFRITLYSTAAWGCVIVFAVGLVLSTIESVCCRGRARTAEVAPKAAAVGVNVELNVTYKRREDGF